MATNYQITIRNPQGVKLADLTQFSRLEYVLTENAIGALTLRMGTEIPAAWYTRDTILEVWRRVDGALPVLEGGTVWFVRVPDVALNSSGAVTHTLTAYDAKDLLRRRIVAYKSTTAQASKTAAYDDMMKAIVRENLGALATDPLRNLGARLTVQANQTLAPVKLKSFAYRNVLTVLQEIADASAGAGVYLSFDIVSTGDTTLEFRTYKGQRGRDLRSMGQASGVGVIVSPDNGNIAEADIKSDYAQEVTVAYGGGAGEALARSLRTAVDARATSSPFNRIEDFLDMSNSSDTEIDNALQARLWEGRPRQTFSGRLTGSGYGRAYGWGDLVTAQWASQAFNVRINPVHVTVDESGESVDCVLNGDALL